MSDEIDTVYLIDEGNNTYEMTFEKPDNADIALEYSAKNLKLIESQLEQVLLRHNLSHSGLKALTEFVHILKSYSNQTNS